MINFLAFNLQAFWKVWLLGGIGLFTVVVSAITVCFLKLINQNIG